MRLFANINVFRFVSSTRALGIGPRIALDDRSRVVSPDNRLNEEGIDPERPKLDSLNDVTTPFVHVTPDHGFWQSPDA